MSGVDAKLSAGVREAGLEVVHEPNASRDPRRDARRDRERIEERRRGVTGLGHRVREVLELPGDASRLAGWVKIVGGKSNTSAPGTAADTLLLLFDS